MEQDKFAKKKVAISREARAFLATLPSYACKQFEMIRQKLETYGFLVAPFGEKVEGYHNLFSIRLISSVNARFFYYYVGESDRIWVLNGFEKKTQKTPRREILRALVIRKRLENENG
jgi:phage-related protein